MKGMAHDGASSHGAYESEPAESEDLVETFLEGRYTEVRMLFYVGRDINRWIHQCVEHVDRQPDTRFYGLTFESFADYLIHRAPDTVRDKLQAWGVLDFRAIFIRAIGLNAVFHECPARKELSPDFIRDYHRFADMLFKARMGEVDFPKLDPARFDFQLFASGEYAKMLERQWS